MEGFDPRRASGMRYRSGTTPSAPAVTNRRPSRSWPGSPPSKTRWSSPRAPAASLNTGTLTAVDAAKAKLWATEVQHRVLDRYLQLFGGYGLMTEYPIARVRRHPGADHVRRHVADHEDDHRPRRDRATA